MPRTGFSFASGQDRLAMPLPDVVIAGAAKCGTTALAETLDASPEFHLGREKEPRFFADLGPTCVGPLSDDFNATLIRDPATYAANFAAAGTASI